MTINDLRQWKEKGNIIILYCAGLHGIEFKKILNILDIDVDFFCDNNCKKINSYIDNVKCISPQMVHLYNNYCIIICTGIENYEKMYIKAKNQLLLNIIDFRKIFDSIISDINMMKIVIEKRYKWIAADLFYTNIERKVYDKIEPIKINKNRIAVYTSCFGKYDDIILPKYFSDNIDYYFISDEVPSLNSSYNWIDAKKIIPANIISPIKRNRYIKMHPDIIFPQYKYSIYVDANIEIKGDLSTFICRSRSGICVFLHSRRDCLYYEAMTIVNYKRIVPEDAILQISKYLKEGMPLHYGLTEMPVIVREHNNPLCKKIMKEWWIEFQNGSQRDQLSFTYVLWKNGLTLNDLAILGSNVRSSDKLKFHKHHKDSISVKNE